ncbi:hypothetical protein SG34_016050 [Thalassomonas viridans]|uniref:Uncharacterized protein n=1 Tax=Thalassomonas viridans TaxID=137584 RepID=A0AAF0C7K7_9GAMM|nr:hypothetical protein [Thalassomonas viridans]WDE02954.1 hypothetical protein SG34_016050 [Thalassomonas viridans]
MKIPSRFDEILETVIKSFGIASRLGIVLGGLALLSYCYQIGYFPEGISAGDTIALIFVSIAFAVLYIIFSASLYALGISLYPLWILLNKLFLFIAKIRNKKITPVEYLKPDPSFIGFSLVGILFVFLVGLSEKSIVITMVICCWMLAISAANRKKIATQISDIELTLSSNILNVSEHQKTELKKNKALLKKMKIQQTTFALLIPLFLGGMSEKIVNGSLNILSLKAPSVTIHVKKPHSNLLENLGLKPVEKSIGPDYKTFKGIDILLRGIGKNTVVAPFPLTPKFNIAIPNENIIIQKKRLSENKNNKSHPTEK